ncbi:hypothetical protein CGRA01v4_05184 [Colletotrichum graminicola]|nr:hypothetical protein CGRA01v4_05184 [Colletotrichum graminicola]
MWIPWANVVPNRVSGFTPPRYILRACQRAGSTYYLEGNLATTPPSLLIPCIRRYRTAPHLGASFAARAARCIAVWWCMFLVGKNDSRLALVSIRILHRLPPPPPGWHMPWRGACEGWIPKVPV